MTNPKDAAAKAHEAWLKLMSECPSVSQDVFRYLYGPFHEHVEAALAELLKFRVALERIQSLEPTAKLYDAVCIASEALNGSIPNE